MVRTWLRSLQAVFAAFAVLALWAPSALAGAAAPPRCVSISPSPGGWFTRPIGLSEIVLRFDKPVVAPSGSITARLGAANPQPVAVTVLPGADPNELRVILPAAVTADYITLVADYSITDAAGIALDGELNTAEGATLPSGDGEPGGQLVVRFRALPGDADRDGFTRFSDLNLVLAFYGQSGPAIPGDVNGDGVVDMTDLMAVLGNYGASLPAIVGASPVVASITPDPAVGLQQPVSEVRVNFSRAVDSGTVSSRSLFLLDESGTAVRTADGVSLSPDGTQAVFSFASAPLPVCGSYRVGLSPAIAGANGALLAVPATAPRLTGLVPSETPTIDPTPAVTTTEFFTFTGQAPGAVSVEIVFPGPVGALLAPVNGGVFTTQVQLPRDSISSIYFTSISPCGVRSAPASRRIAYDASAPNLFIDYPAPGAELTGGAVTVLGRVSDDFSGFTGLTVTVNGAPATVTVGGGNV